MITPSLPLPLVELARTTVLLTKSASVANLQVQLGLQYGVALALIERLEKDGLLVGAFGNRPRAVHQRYLRMHVRDIAGSPRPRYVRRLTETALYFFEMWEEQGQGDTRAIDAIKPQPSTSFRILRELFLQGWYGQDRLTLTNATLAFHAWLIDKGHVIQDAGSIEDAIRSECFQHDRIPFFEYERPARIERAYLRLARYYRQMVSDGVSRDSRAAEWFIPREFIPTGDSAAGTYHPEHVVPCKVIRDVAIRYYEDEKSIEEVVRLIMRWLVIVRTSEAEMDALDNGGEALRDRMPSGWDEEHGCIYDRLHAKNITFMPPAEQGCKCASNTSWGKHSAER